MDASEAVLAEADVDESVGSGTASCPPLPPELLVALEYVDVVSCVEAETEDTIDWVVALEAKESVRVLGGMGDGLADVGVVGGTSSWTGGMTSSFVGSIRKDELGLDSESEDFVCESNSDDAEPSEPILFALALEVARPRGTREPAPGADADTLGSFAGKETDAERMFVFEIALRESADMAGGVGEPKRLIVGELIREGDVAGERLRSIVDVIKRRVSNEGASSSSLECMRPQLP